MPMSPTETTLAPCSIQNDLIQSLQSKIHQVETADRVKNDLRISSGCAAIDKLLPGRGYAPGTITQWLTDGGYGVDYLSLLAARQACLTGGALAVLDPYGQFYPPTASALGFEMGNVIILRPPQRQRKPISNGDPNSDWYWAIDQSLRCGAVAAVWGPIGIIEERWFRRFQLSAESSGCLGLFIQPASAAQHPSWAEVQWLATAPANDSRPHYPAGDGCRQSVRLQLTRCRGAQTGQRVVVSINAVTGEVI